MPRLMAGHFRFCFQVAGVVACGLVEDAPDRLSVFEAHIFVFVNDDAVEQCPVQYASFVRFTLVVKVIYVSEDVRDVIKAFTSACERISEAIEPVGDGVKCSTDAVLFGLE